MSLLAIVGRPNVGKSTLFNRLMGKRIAIVEDVPGVTRDRNYADAEIDGRMITLVDTGGLDPESEDELMSSMADQVGLAVDEADFILFVVDAHEGAMPGDSEIAQYLRRREKDVILVVNKVDGQNWEAPAAEFYSMGFEHVHFVSAEHKRGIGDLTDEIVRQADDIEPAEVDEDEIRVAILGRPNVGKSSLVNKLLGAERVVVSPIAGTTRDMVDIRLTYEDKPYLLIDTAGMRKKSRVKQGVERWSVMKAIRAIERSQVCVLMVEAVEGITDQDLRILDLILRGGRGAVICLNKWDLVEKDGKTFDVMRKEIAFRLGPYRHVPVISISALTGQRTHRIFEFIDKLKSEWEKRIPTSQLNRMIEEAVRTNPPPVVGRKRTRIYYATQVTDRPPAIALFCSYPEGIPTNYERYLVNRFRATFGFDGVPVRFYLRARKRADDKSAISY